MVDDEHFKKELLNMFTPLDIAEFLKPTCPCCGSKMTGYHFYSSFGDEWETCGVCGATIEYKDGEIVKVWNLKRIKYEVR